MFDFTVCHFFFGVEKVRGGGGFYKKKKEIGGFGGWGGGGWGGWVREGVRRGLFSRPR